MIYRRVPNKAAELDGVAEIVPAQLSVNTADPNKPAAHRRTRRFAGREGGDSARWPPRLR
jgi:hypothetical protein